MNTEEQGLVTLGNQSMNYSKNECMFLFIVHE